jgi:hypothetical protein
VSGFAGTHYSLDQRRPASPAKNVIFLQFTCLFLAGNSVAAQGDPGCLTEISPKAKALQGNLLYVAEVLFSPARLLCCFRIA